MGVSLSSRKVRGGIGLQLGLGITLSFTYIMFMQISTTFATNGNFPPVLAVWIPNTVFSGIAIWLIRNSAIVGGAALLILDELLRVRRAK